jgi:hypothetical protein
MGLDIYYYLVDRLRAEVKALPFGRGYEPLRSGEDQSARGLRPALVIGLGGMAIDFLLATILKLGC